MPNKTKYSRCQSHSHNQCLIFKLSKRLQSSDLGVSVGVGCATAFDSGFWAVWRRRCGPCLTPTYARYLTTVIVVDAFCLPTNYEQKKKNFIDNNNEEFSQIQQWQSNNSNIYQQPRQWQSCSLNRNAYTRGRFNKLA